ncbi:50S ribosomal protein L29 [candidate division KSB1 bacterium]|nr:50S ribosomal protein L29 [candidate division KSB1 bacterium]RQW05840.1 MAG: 50S ribosomal protein L29 [candidate division KSB1 bacterium]
MKMDEIRQLTFDEVKNRLEDAQEEMENLRFLHSTHQLDNAMRLRLLRKDIARLKTVLREHELAATGR